MRRGGPPAQRSHRTCRTGGGGGGRRGASAHWPPRQPINGVARRLGLLRLGGRGRAAGGAHTSNAGQMSPALAGRAAPRREGNFSPRPPRRSRPAGRRLLQPLFGTRVCVRERVPKSLPQQFPEAPGGTGPPRAGGGPAARPRGAGGRARRGRGGAHATAARQLLAKLWRGAGPGRAEPRRARRRLAQSPRTTTTTYLAGREGGREEGKEGGGGGRRRFHRGPFMAVAQTFI